MKNIDKIRILNNQLIYLFDNVFLRYIDVFSGVKRIIKITIDGSYNITQITEDNKN